MTFKTLNRIMIPLGKTLSISLDLADKPLCDLLLACVIVFLAESCTSPPHPLFFNDAKSVVTHHSLHMSSPSVLVSCYSLTYNSVLLAFHAISTFSFFGSPVEQYLLS